MATPVFTDTIVYTVGGTSYPRFEEALAAAQTLALPVTISASGSLVISDAANTSNTGNTVPVSNTSPSPNTTSQLHSVVATVITSSNSVWTASAQVREDPTVSGVRVRFVDTANNVHPGLVAYFYADGCDIGATLASNAYDYVNNKLVVTYDGVQVPIASTNGKGTFDFWRGCRNQTVRYGIQAKWDATKIDKTLLPNYAPGQQLPFNDSKFKYGYNALGLATYPDMGATGDRADIGFFPQWVTAFLTNPSDTSFAIMRRADDNSGVWPIYWEDDAGNILDVTKYPNASMLSYTAITVTGNPIVAYGGSYDGASLNAANTAYHISGTSYIWDQAHQTAYNFVSAMVTGSARDKEHASFHANAPLIAFNPAYRQKTGVFEHYQERGTAWALRSLFLGSYLTVNTAYFASQMNVMLALANAHIGSNAFGFQDTYVHPGFYGPTSGLAFWNENYTRFVLDVIWNKLSAWKPYAVYLGTAMPLMMANPYYPLSTVYKLTVKDAAGNWLPGIPAMFCASLQEYGWALADAQAITAPSITAQDVYNQIVAHNKTANIAWGGTYSNGYCDFMQYDAAPGAYPILMRVAVFCAVNAGVTGIDAALTIINNVPTKPNCAGDYRFNIVPRV